MLPSVFILTGLSYLYAAHGDSTLASGMLWGFRPVVVAIVVEAVFRIGKRAFHRRWHVAVALAAFVSIYVLSVPFPFIVLVAAILGWSIARARPSLAARAEMKGPAAPLHETAALPLVIDDDSPPAAHTLPSLRRAIVVVAVFIALWIAGLGLLVAISGSDSLHVREYAFFTKAAFVTFGGAYAVLAYVSQAVVEQFAWLTHAQTVDGLALAETTPGPLIMVLQFVGFMAAWNHPVSGLTPLESALAGGLATTYATFLPCFLFIFLGAPWIEQLRANRHLDGALQSVTAAVVGVILNLALVFGSAVLLPASGRPDWLAAILAAAAFVALWKFRVDVLVVVLAGGLAGLMIGML